MDNQNPTAANQNYVFYAFSCHELQWPSRTGWLQWDNLSFSDALANGKSGLGAWDLGYVRASGGAKFKNPTPHAHARHPSFDMQARFLLHRAHVNLTMGHCEPYDSI